MQAERELERSGPSPRVHRRRLRGLGFVLAACAVAALIAGSAGAVDPTFVPATGSPFAVGPNPYSIAVGDVSGDGKVDVAAANESSDNVTVLQGDGVGGFSAQSPVAVGDVPESVAIADLNGDGMLDMAVANGGSDNVSILLADGAGGFNPATGSPFPAGDQPWYVLIANLNADTKPDLAVARFSDTVSNGEVAILIGDGLGGFAAPSFVAAGRVPYGLAAADLSGDGKIDLAVANQYSGNVSILLGNGLGAFSAAAGSPVTTGGGPSWVAASDLNGDSKPDLVVTNQATDNVSILLGDGAAGFSAAPGSPVAAGNGPTPLAVTDLNSDTKLDLAVGNAFSDDVSILVGDGLAGFRPAAGSPVAAGDAPFSLAAVDLNADGKRDLAVGNYLSSNVSVLLNSSATTAVALRGFVARRTSQGVGLRWQTAQESGLLGFNLYRSGVKFNPKLIAARGSAASGAVYRLLDRQAPVGASSTYQLQGVGVDGNRYWIGKVTAKRSR